MKRKLSSASQDAPSYDSKQSKSDTSNTQVGTLLWGKLSGYPWWPCLVAPTPEKSSNNLKRAKLFVLFFGPTTEHAMILENLTVEYQGLESFKLFAQAEVDKMNSKSAKEKLAERYKLKIPKTRGNDWLQAIEEADQALGVPEHDRQRTFFSPEVKLKKEMDRKKRKENEALIKNESEESNKQLPSVEETRNFIRQRISGMINIGKNLKNLSDYSSRLQLDQRVIIQDYFGFEIGPELNEEITVSKEYCYQVFEKIRVELVRVLKQSALKAIDGNTAVQRALVALKFQVPMLDVELIQSYAIESGCSKETLYEEMFILKKKN